MPPDEFATFDDWRAATQAYQAALIQLQIEDLRRLRYRPTGGFLQFCFADGHPGVTWSVLDHERRPKAGHGALAAACRSVLPMLDPRTGHVHVANELRTPFPGAEVEVQHRRHTWRFGGDLAADSLAYVGTVPLPPGCRAVTAILRCPDFGPIENYYGETLLGAACRCSTHFCRDVVPPTSGRQRYRETGRWSAEIRWWRVDQRRPARRRLRNFART